MFSQPGSAALSERYTAVRLVGGEDMTAEGRAFAEHYGVYAYPSLLALTHDGALLDGNLPRDLEGMLAAMKLASAADADFRAVAAKLGDSKAPSALRTMAGWYEQRMQWKRARAAWEAVIAEKPLVEDQLALLGVLEALADTEARKALLRTLIDTHKEHGDHIRWRIALATADAPQAVDSVAAREARGRAVVKALEALLPQVSLQADQAFVRRELAATLHELRDVQAALIHWNWILGTAKQSAVVPDALMGKGTMLVHRGYGEGKLATVQEGRALLQRLIAEHPRHALAADARRMLAQVDLLIEQLKPKNAK